MDKSCAKELVDYPGYWIYPNGQLWSDKSQKFLKDSAGGYRGKYRKYMLYVNEKQKMKYVHRLLMQYFGPPMPENATEVNHIDGNTANNCLGNLEWVSSSQNTRHAANCGLFSRVKLNPDQVKEIKIKLRDEPEYHGKTANIAREYGVSYRVISQIKHGKNWSYITID